MLFLLSITTILSFLIIIIYSGFPLSREKTNFIRFLKLILLSLCSTLIISSGFIVEPILKQIFLPSSSLANYEPNAIFALYNIIFTIGSLFLPSTILIIIIYRVDNFSHRLIRSFLFIAITLILIDLVYYIYLIPEDFNIRVILFSMLNNIIGSAIAGIIISTISYQISDDKYQPNLLTHNFLKKLSSIIITLIIALVSVFFIFFYQYPHKFRLTLSDWRALSFEISKENVRYAANKDFLDFPINVNSILTNTPSNKIDIKIDNNKPDRKESSIYSIIAHDHTNNIMDKKNFEGGNIEIDGINIFMKISDNNLNKAIRLNIGIPTNCQVIFIKKKWSNLEKIDKGNYIKQDNLKEITMAFDEFVYKPFLSTSEDTLKVIIGKEHKGFRLEIFNWENIRYGLSGMTYLNKSGQKLIKILMPDKEQLLIRDTKGRTYLNITNDEKRGDKMIVDNNYGGYSFITDEFKFPLVRNRLFINNLAIFNPIGKIDVSDNNYKLNQEDELTIIANDISLSYNLDNELVVSGQSRDILLNTKMLTFTTWESISSGVKSGLIGLITFLLGVLMNPIREWLFNSNKE